MKAPALHGYRRDVDGLRALAVLPVVLFHAGFVTFSGGFVGVDIFFVISGFLITSLIFREIRDGQFSLWAFYERRVRRIFPALFVMLAATVPVALWMLLPEDLASYSKSLASTALSVSNMFFWSESGYFDAPALLKPLLHTWSLAVEEQFYVFFPLLLWAVWRWGGRRGVLPVFVLGAALSLLLSVWGVDNKPEATFYMLPTRAWELLMGALLALGIPVVKRGVLNEGLALAGLGMIVFSIFTYTHKTPFPGLAAVWPCLGAALIIYAGQVQATLVGRVLSLPPVVFVGKISYSLYLWHWPLLVFAGYYLIRPLTHWEGGGLLVLAGVLATLSLYYVEAPFRGKGAWGNRRQVYVAAAVAIAAACVVGGAGALAKGVPQRFTPEVLQILKPQQYRDASFYTCHQVYKLHLKTLCKLGDTTQSVTFLVLGDSHGGAMAPAVFAAAKESGRAGLQITDSGYIALPGYIKHGEPEKYRVMNKMVAKALVENPQVRDIVMVNYWKQAIFDNLYTTPDGELVDGQTAVADGIATFAKAQPQITFWLMEDNPMAAVFGMNAAARARAFGFKNDFGIPRADEVKYRATYTPLLGKLAELPNVRVVPIADSICSAETCPAKDEQARLMYKDDNHLSLTGALRTVPSLKGMFAH